MTAPFIDFGMDPEGRRERMRRSIMDALQVTPQGPGTPGPQYQTPDAYLPAQPPSGRYSLAEIGNATVSRPPEGSAHPVRERILAALDGALRGVAVGNDPDQPGTTGFLGALGRGYAGVQDMRSQRERQAQIDREESLLRQAQIDRELRMRTSTVPKYGAAAWIPDPENPETEVYAGQNPTTGALEPKLMNGHPVVRQAQGKSPSIGRRGQPRVTQNAHGGLIVVDPLTGRARPVTDSTGQQVLGKPTAPAQVQQQMTQFGGLMQTMDDLDRVGGLLDQFPNSVGLAFAGPDVVNQRLDPEGVATRAALADINTTLLNLRSGQAVTEGEYQRLAPLVPRPSDTQQAVRVKLQRLRLQLTRIRKRTSQTYGTMGQETDDSTSTRRPRVNPSDIP